MGKGSKSSISLLKGIFLLPCETQHVHVS